MCNLTGRYKGKEFVGYKVVIEKNGKNYSGAMGFCYDDFEEIPIMKTQNRLTDYFRSDILVLGDIPYKTIMKGRTTVFRNYSDALLLFNDIINYKSTPIHQVRIKKAKVSKALMRGTYGYDDVVAGRKIEFLEDVTSNINKGDLK